jgi:hypothetical protein
MLKNWRGSQCVRLRKADMLEHEIVMDVNPEGAMVEKLLLAAQMPASDFILIFLPNFHKPRGLNIGVLPACCSH